MVLNLRAFAHGENKLGPHKGYIKMPGSFHTEVVMDGKDKIKVYLIDMEWKNPSVKKSSLSVILDNKKETISADCKIIDDHYSCSFSKPVNLYRKAELKIQSEREGIEGAEIIYTLPLRINVNPNDEHNVHTMQH